MSGKVALAQMDIFLGEPQRNLAQVRNHARAAREAGAELLLLPELWSTGYVLEQAESLATAISEGVMHDLAQIAREYRLAILGSTLIRLEGGGIGNTAVYLDVQGQAVAQYSKIHLFGLMDEPRYLTAGTGPTRVDTPWGKAGLAICYDLRFPELFRSYAVAGIDLILLVAEWPQPRVAHWRTLLQARAIENQAFVVACNRAGVGGTTTFAGHSMVIDPWGEILREAEDQPGLHLVALDPTRLQEARTRLPVLRDRRPECYF